jgi:hypothetical protein
MNGSCETAGVLEGWARSDFSFSSFQYAYGYDDRSDHRPHLAESAYTLE